MLVSRDFDCGLHCKGELLWQRPFYVGSHQDECLFWQALESLDWQGTQLVHNCGHPSIGELEPILEQLFVSSTRSPASTVSAIGLHQEHHVHEDLIRRCSFTVVLQELGQTSQDHVQSHIVLGAFRAGLDHLEHPDTLLIVEFDTQNG